MTFFPLENTEQNSPASCNLKEKKILCPYILPSKILVHLMGWSALWLRKHETYWGRGGERSGGGQPVAPGLEIT
jgi:hypothetical protein